MIQHRRAFALLTVLWVLIGIGILALGAALAGRNALASARNRTALATARWHAEGCIERVRATAYDIMTRVPSDAVIAVWDSLDHVIATSPFLTGTTCIVTVRAAGTALDVNTIDATELSRLFTALNIAPARADSLTDALLDWRDADTVTRPLGAEHDWYITAHRHPPRNGPLADTRELTFIRGFEHMGDTLNVFGTVQTRISLSHAPLPVLAALPGFTPEVLARIADLRLRNERLPELIALSGTLPADARETLIAHYAELTRRTTPEPEGWIVQARAASGEPKVEASVEVYLARGGTRVAIMRRR